MTKKNKITLVITIIIVAALGIFGYNYQQTRLSGVYANDDLKMDRYQFSNDQGRSLKDVSDSFDDLFGQGKTTDYQIVGNTLTYTVDKKVQYTATLAADRKSYTLTKVKDDGHSYTGADLKKYFIDDGGESLTFTKE